MFAGIMRKNGRRLAAFLVALLFLALAFLYIREKELRVDTQLIIGFKTSHADTCRLIIDRGRGLKARLKKGQAVQVVEFPLPGKKIDRVRLQLSVKPGLWEIGDIKVRNLLSVRHWPVKLEPGGPGNEKLSRQMKGNVLHIRSRGGEPVLVFDQGLADLANRVGGQETIFYLIALLVSLLLFYLTYHFTFKNWALLLKPRVSTGLALLFLLVIFVPLVIGMFNLAPKIDTHPLQENRVLAPKPHFRFASPFAFFPRYRDYYNDHFNFRRLLIPVYNYLEVKLFHVSPLPHVLLGKQGWLFMAWQNERIREIDYFRRIEPFTPGDLERWRICLEQRRNWLKSRGIHYLFMVTANKSTIYPELVPDRFRRLDGPSRLDQLIDYLGKHSDIDVLDLRQAMWIHKKKHPVYRPTDTHWNEYGAYLGYLEIVKALARFYPDIRPVYYGEEDIRIIRRDGGDLALMLSLQDSLFREETLELKRKPVSAREGQPLKEKYPWVSVSVKERPGTTLPRAIIVHDSFAARFKRFLSEHFSRVVYLRDWKLNFYLDLIKKEKPGLVIDQTTERFLMDLQPVNPPELSR